MSGSNEPSGSDKASPPATAERRSSAVVHLGLFVATCGTTFLSGAGIFGDFQAARGAYFAATIMCILVCHEMGHYVVARRHGIDASLPYFIPLPPVISLGTLGAVIKMDEPISDRDKLLDVGAAGPLAGLAAAIPLLVWGLSMSPVGIAPPVEGTMIEGNSILYLALKYAVHGAILPSDSGLDVQLHPVAFAAWVGLLITMINLLPIGQLDGGHIAASALGNRHERFSMYLHWGLLGVGIAVAAVMSWRYMQAGLTSGQALETAVKAGLPWIVWAALLLFMRRLGEGRYHPPVGNVSLSRSRRALVAFMLIVFASIFTPVPLREAPPLSDEAEAQP